MCKDNPPIKKKYLPKWKRPGEEPRLQQAKAPFKRLTRHNFIAGSRYNPEQRAKRFFGKPEDVAEMKKLFWSQREKSLARAIKRSKRTRPPQYNHQSVKLNWRDVVKIKDLLREGNLTMRKIAKLYDISHTTIWKIKHNLLWTEIGENLI